MPAKKKCQGGSSAAYRTGRLERRHPEVAERLAAGEFKSVSEAERVAGVRPAKRNTKRCSIDLDNPAESIEILIAQYLPTHKLSLWAEKDIREDKL